MSNAVGNDLIIWGPSADVQLFKTTVHDPETNAVFSLERALPLPVTPEGMAQAHEAALASDDASVRFAAQAFGKHGTPEIAAAFNVWGTKWDVSNPEILREEALEGARHLLAYRMSSPGSPPLAAIKTLAEKYPSLTLLLATEEGSNFAFGVNLYVAGELVLDVELTSYPWALDTVETPLDALGTDALSHLRNGWLIPTLVSAQRPAAADELVATGLWEENTITAPDHPEAMLWTATANAHMYMLETLLDEPDAFEAVYEHDSEEREQTELAGFASFLRDNAGLLSSCDDTRTSNVARYLFADLFDAPVDESVAADVKAMLKDSSPIELTTYLLTATRHEDNERTTFVSSYCAATSRTAV